MFILFIINFLLLAVDTHKECVTGFDILQYFQSRGNDQLAQILPEFLTEEKLNTALTQN